MGGGPDRPPPPRSAAKYRPIGERIEVHAMHSTRQPAHAHAFEEFLGDVQYPADKQALAKAARKNKAPENVQRRLERLPEQTFPDLREVRLAWAQDEATNVEATPSSNDAAGQTSTRPSGTRHG